MFDDIAYVLVGKMCSPPEKVTFMKKIIEYTTYLDERKFSCELLSENMWSIHINSTDTNDFYKAMMVIESLGEWVEGKGEKYSISSQGVVSEFALFEGKMREKHRAAKFCIDNVFSREEVLSEGELPPIVIAAQFKKEEEWCQAEISRSYLNILVEHAVGVKIFYCDTWTEPCSICLNRLRKEVMGECSSCDFSPIIPLDNE